ncbi:MAG: PepSY domain-containing protein [Methanobacterium sp.]
MIGKSIIAIILVAALIGIGYAAHASAQDNNNITNQTPTQNITNNNTTTPNNTTTTTVATNNSQNTESSQNLISSAEAQSIAQTYIIQPNAQAGTPILKEINGEQIYTVPVILNGNNVGEIDIDAQTGKNVGGAGGA